MQRPSGDGVSNFVVSSSFDFSMTKIGSQVAPKIGRPKVRRVARYPDRPS